jgi:hypothetical protein
MNSMTSAGALTLQCMYMCICVYVYMCIYVYVYMRVGWVKYNIHTYTHTYIHTYIPSEITGTPAAHGGS